MPWALALGAAYLIVMGVLWVALKDGGARAENVWVTFLGRFHFIFLHIPIAVVLAVFAIELMSVFKAVRPARAAAPFLLWFAALGGIGATVCGYLLSLSGGYGEEMLERHFWAGIGVAVGTIITLVIKLLAASRSSTGLNLLYLFFLVVTVGVLMLASHDGGSLTHGSDFLTKHMPPELKKLAGLPVDEDGGGRDLTKVPVGQLRLYQDLVEPVFERKCWKCHSESKSKGDYRMDTFEAMMEGGENPPAVVPGDLEDGELFYLLTTDDEDDVMPPTNKPPMTEEEIALVAWWIEKGAPENKNVGELEDPLGDEIKKLIAAVLGQAADWVPPEDDDEDEEDEEDDDEAAREEAGPDANENEEDDDEADAPEGGEMKEEGSAVELENASEGGQADSSDRSDGSDEDTAAPPDDTSEAEKTGLP